MTRSPRPFERLKARAAMIAVAVALTLPGAAFAQKKADPNCGVDPTCSGRSNIPGGVERAPAADMAAPRSATPFVQGSTGAAPSVAPLMSAPAPVPPAKAKPAKKKAEPTPETQ